MIERNSTAIWKGSLTEGTGHLSLESGVWSGPYDWKSRSAAGSTTNPEELIAAAHAGCFNMALSHGLTQAGFAPEELNTVAKVRLEQVDGGFAITHIQLELDAKIAGITEEEFNKQVEGAKVGCPVSKALAGTNISLNARLHHTEAV